MRTIRLLTVAAAFGLLAAALPALAASQGDISSIALQDFNHDGRIDHAVVSIANSTDAAWQVRGTAGLKATYQGQPLTIRAAFMASTGNPAKLEIAFDENLAQLPSTTAAGGFSITYDQQGVSNGITDGTVEMAAIGSDLAPLDQAAPVLLSSSPAAGTIDAKRDADLTLTFSEPISTDGITVSSSQNPDAWGFSVSGNVLTVVHAPYGRGVTESFGLDAHDAAGNHVAVGPYPNPFSFRTGTTNDPTPSLDTVFTLTAPQSLQTLTSGAPNVVAWYTNESDVAKVRLSYSTDGGSTYVPFVARPVTDGAYVWYPPVLQSTIQLKAEALNASGAVVNVALVSPVSLTGTAAVPPRVVAGPDIVRITPTAAQAAVDLDRTPTSVSAACGGVPSTVTVVGDRPARLEALAEGLTATPITCRFVISDGVSEVLVVETPSIAAESAAPLGEGFLELKEGDLIKSESSSAVYWYKGGARWVFPNEMTYKSWFGADFSKVMTVPAAQLAALMIGGNVRVKEGVYLLKIQSDPKTYAVEPEGVLRWIQTEAQAQILYGAAWNTRVRDVDVSLWVDYRIGTPLQDGEHPAGYAG